MKSEYMVASTTTQEAFWIRYLGVNIKPPIIMFEDNKACISFSDHPGNYRNSKHIDYRHHFAREGVQRGDIKLVYGETLKQTADILTKALDPEKFIRFRDALVMSRSLLKIIKT